MLWPPQNISSGFILRLYKFLILWFSQVIDMSDQNNKKDADARSMYEINVEDIRWAKGRIWTSTYYILTLYAGFIAISNFECQIFKNNIFQIILAFLATIIAVVGIRHLIETHYNLVCYRRRLVKLRLIYHKDVREIISIEKDYTSFKRYLLDLLLPFMGSIISGYFIVYYSYYITNIRNSPDINKTFRNYFLPTHHIPSRIPASSTTFGCFVKCIVIHI
jgi:hypothetical protein